jgi:hypothetical protein
MHHGRIVFDGPTEGAIARHHELPTSDEDSEEFERGSVRVEHRELLHVDGKPAGTVQQDAPLIYRVRLHFEEPVHSPQVLFQVYAEDGTFVYQMQTPLGEAWRGFPAGAEVSLDVKFLPRFGGGGTFRNVLVVTSIDTSITFVRDDGLAYFVEPRVGAAGISDLEATIIIDGEDRTEARPLRFGAYGAVVEGG